MLPVSNIVVGVDFGAPRRARDQRRKIPAIVEVSDDVTVTVTSQFGFARIAACR